MLVGKGSFVMPSMESMSTNSREELSDAYLSMLIVNTQPVSCVDAVTMQQFVLQSAPFALVVWGNKEQTFGVGRAPDLSFVQGSTDSQCIFLSLPQF